MLEQRGSIRYFSSRGMVVSKSYIYMERTCELSLGYLRPCYSSEQSVTPKSEVLCHEMFRVTVHIPNRKLKSEINFVECQLGFRSRLLLLMKDVPVLLKLRLPSCV